ncbi:MAG: hypothetical protein ACTHLJ_06100 [Angustibacter sp.]
MNLLSTVRTRTCAVVGRLATAVVAAFAVAVLAATRAAALVPPPDDPSSGGAPAPASTAVSSPTHALLFIGVSLAALVLVATIAGIRARRLSLKRHATGAPAAA